MTPTWNASRCGVQDGSDCGWYKDSLFSTVTRKWIACKMTCDAEYARPRDNYDIEDYSEWNVSHVRCDFGQDASLAFFFACQAQAIDLVRDARCAFDPSPHTGNSFCVPLCRRGVTPQF